MSVKLPPQVEFKRLGRRNALSFTSSRRGPAITPQTCTFLPKAIRSGFTPKCSEHQVRPVVPRPRLHFVEDQEHLVLVADLAQLLQQLAAEMIVAAFALDRLDDDRGDVDAALVDELPDLLPPISSRARSHPLRARIPAARNRCDGFETRGQLNFANKSVFRGSVFVRLMV